MVLTEVFEKQAHDNVDQTVPSRSVRGCNSNRKRDQEGRYCRITLEVRLFFDA